LLFAVFTFGQETTAGLQGTVKDSSGAVIKGAQVTVTANTLVGQKTISTDSSGYYRFANLPPGAYTVTVGAPGFSTSKNQGLVLEVGHLPTVNFSLEVGKTQTVVEVSGETPAIDVGTNHTMTNVTEDIINNVPHGDSYQSMIQFSPMARNEPLGGAHGGTGGAMPGSSGNGQQYGYSIGGAADSSPVPSLQQTSNGSILGLRYDPSSSGAQQVQFGGGFDAAAQVYQPKQDHYRYLQPGFAVGGPIVKDRLWFFAGLAPFVQS